MAFEIFMAEFSLIVDKAVSIGIFIAKIDRSFVSKYLFWKIYSTWLVQFIDKMTWYIYPCYLILKSRIKRNVLFNKCQVDFLWVFPNCEELVVTFE